MKILTYSERGLVDSLVYSLNDGKTKELLERIYGNKLSDNAKDFQFYLEHSLSDFGSPDLLISFKNNNIDTLIFVEAKVSNGNQNWSLQKQYEDYCHKADKDITSNFFRQIALKDLLIKNRINLSDAGVTSEDHRIIGRKENRKLGNNDIVKKLFNDVIKNAKDVWYLGLVPDKEIDLNKMKKENKKDHDLFSEIEYCTWAEIKEFATKNKMYELLENFEWNKGLIFNDN